MPFEDVGEMEQLGGKGFTETDKGNCSPPTPALLAGYLTEPEAAAELGLMPRTLRKYRDQGTGPAYVVIGRCARYPRDGLLEWINSKIVSPVRERKPARRRSA
jgi:hypothetical protein